MQQPDYQIQVSWYEVTKQDGQEVRFLHGRVYTAPDRDSAKLLLAGARQDNGWAPETAHDVQIDVVGPDLLSYEPKVLATR